MKRFRLLLVAIVLTLASCYNTYYSYHVEAVCEACEDKGGINRFVGGREDIWVFCNDGTMVKVQRERITQ